MPPKVRTAGDIAAPAEQRVDENATTFGLTEDVFADFCRRARCDLRADDAEARGLSPFLDPTNRDRYVVVSVDPAGGGVLSDEAFLVFMVTARRFGLLTGRIVSGHTGRYGFSMIPLVFVAALLQTIRGVNALLQQAYRRSAYAHRLNQRGESLPPFVMPTVLVLIENNFAYGASTYNRGVRYVFF